MYNPYKLFTSAPKEKALLAGYYVPRMNFKSGHFAYL